MMDRVILGDNQFFAVNHLSDERSRAQAIRFKEDKAIIDVLDNARACGINTFMCTTHDRIANICKALHLKFNVAMLFLVDEMYKNVHKEFRVAFGKPIPWQTFDKSHTPQEWAKIVEDKVYEL